MKPKCSPKSKGNAAEPNGVAKAKPTAGVSKPQSVAAVSKPQAAGAKPTTAVPKSKAAAKRISIEKMKAKVAAEDGDDDSTNASDEYDLRTDRNDDDDSHSSSSDDDFDDEGGDATVSRKRKRHFDSSVENLVTFGLHFFVTREDMVSLCFPSKIRWSIVDYYSRYLNEAALFAPSGPRRCFFLCKFAFVSLFEKENNGEENCTATVNELYGIWDAWVDYENSADQLMQADMIAGRKFLRAEICRTLVLCDMNESRQDVLGRVANFNVIKAKPVYLNDIEERRKAKILEKMKNNKAEEPAEEAEEAPSKEPATAANKWKKKPPQKFTPPKTE